MTIFEEIVAACAADEQEKKKIENSFKKEPPFKRNVGLEPHIENVKAYYKDLARRLRKGDVPEEWQRIWGEIREIVRYNYLKDLSSVPNRVALHLNVTYSYYSKYFLFDINKPKMKRFSTGRLLNGYLTRQLKKEGFKTACVRLVHARGNPWAKQMNANIQANYERELGDWQAKKANYDSFKPDGIAADPAHPGKAPSAPTFYSASETQYYFHVLCSPVKDKSLKYGISDAELKETDATMRRVIR